MSNIKKIILIIVPLIIFVALLFLAIYLGWDGVFLGPSATIFAVIITINYNSIKDKEERRLSIQPYLTTSYSLCSISDFKETNDNDVFVVIEADTLSLPIASNKIPDCLINLTEESRTNIRPSYINYSEWPEYQNYYHFMNLSITNIGAGNAINMDITINDGGLSNFHVKLNHTRLLKIAFNSEKLKADKSFPLCIHYKYWDVATIAQYEQIETMHIRRGENKVVQIYQIDQDFLSKPKRINKRLYKPI